MKKLFLTVFLLPSLLYGQPSVETNLDIEKIIEEVFQTQQSDVNYEELYEALLLHLSHPIDLNRADESDLESLYLMGASQIRQFIDYRNTHGPLVSVFELQAVPGLDPLTISRLLPFVKVSDADPARSWRGLAKRIKSAPTGYLLLRYERTLEEKKGFTPAEDDSENRYLGNADKLYARFRTSKSKDFSLGFTLEKDAGEPLAYSPETHQYGPDFISYHAQVMNKGKLSNLILGDYQIQRGQGLIFGAGFDMGKGAETITTTRRANTGLRPYSSVAETGYFRGIAATVKPWTHLSVTTMYSRLNQSALLRHDSASAIRSFQTLRTGGLHRTASELISKNTVNEENAGLNVNFKKGRFAAGFNMLNTRYSFPRQPAHSIDNNDDFRGDHNYAYSTYVDIGYANYSVFTEIGRSRSGGFGGLLGLIANLSRKTETSLVFRHYDKNFHSFYGHAFGESFGNRNEQGIYWGIKYRHSGKLLVTAFFDAFRHPGLRSSVSRPSIGHEYLTRISYRPTEKSDLYLQVSQQSTMENIPGEELDGQVKVVATSTRNRYLLNYDYDISKMVSMKSRLQWSNQTANGNRTQGFAMIQDVNIRYKRWYLSSRIGLFDTDDFANRQYIYERDVLYAFSLPALSGQGLRSYFLVRYKASRTLDFWIKYSRTSFTDREKVGDGLEEIDDSKRTVVRAQMRVKF